MVVVQNPHSLAPSNFMSKAGEYGRNKSEAANMSLPRDGLG